MRSVNDSRFFPVHRFAPALSIALVAGALLFGGLAPVQAESPPEAVRNYNQGIDAYNLGKTDDALKKFTTTVQLDPGYVDAYYNMGSIYFQQKKYDQSVTMFQKAVNLMPADAESKYSLALALEKTNRYDEALSMLSQISATSSKGTQAKTKAAQIREEIKKAPPPTKPGGIAPMAKLTTTPFSKGYDGPTGIVIGPGGFMYVANYSKNTIYRVGASGEKTIFAQGDSIKGPIGLVYNPKADELYVANYVLNNVTRINAAGKTAVLVGGLNKPYNLFLDTVNNTLYISEQDPANIISRVVLPK